MPTRHDPDDVEHIHRSAVLFAHNVRTQAWDVYDGLSFVGYGLLEQISLLDCPHAADLVAAYGLDKSTVSRQLADLEQAGLLTRSPDPAHPRCQRLTLTAEADRRLLRTRLAQRAALDAELATWDPLDVSTFARLLARFAASDGASHDV